MELSKSIELKNKSILEEYLVDKDKEVFDPVLSFNSSEL